MVKRSEASVKKKSGQPNERSDTYRRVSPVRPASDWLSLIEKEVNAELADW